VTLLLLYDKLSKLNITSLISFHWPKVKQIHRSNIAKLHLLSFDQWKEIKLVILNLKFFNGDPSLLYDKLSKLNITNLISFHWPKVEQIHRSNIAKLHLLSFGQWKEIKLVILNLKFSICARLLFFIIFIMDNGGISFIIIVKNPGCFEDDTCVICLEKYQKNELLKKLACAHIFHKRCIGKINKKKHCPLCRKIFK
jgi:hypothetical protein